MEENENGVVINEKSMEVLIAKFIPTSQYFEARFDHMQYQIDELKDGVKNLRLDMNVKFEQVDKRFEQVDKRFEQIDTRFEQVDKRFEQVDKRLEQINDKLDRLLERIDVKIDRGLAENRSATFKLFSFAMIFSAISMAGLLGKFANLF